MSQILLVRWQPPLAEFMSQPQCGLLPQRLPDDENEVGPPRVMMTSAAAPATRGLAQLIAWSIIRGHDVCQLMKACLLALADVQAVVRADLHPALASVSVTDSPAADNGHRVRVRRECGPEPLPPLDGMDVSCALPVTYYPVILHKHFAS
jgi:hypothetical protein